MNKESTIKKVVTLFFCGTESEWGDDFNVGPYWDGELINKLRSNMAGIMGQTTYPFLMSQNQWFKKENTRVYVQGEMGEKQKDGTFHGDAHYDRSPGKDLNWGCPRGSSIRITRPCTNVVAQARGLCYPELHRWRQSIPTA